MKEQDQFAACAELDGFENIFNSCGLTYGKRKGDLQRNDFLVPDYNSRDVMIPLILKCDKSLIVDVEVVRKHKLRSVLEASTDQLREELLRAEGKWI